MKYKWMKLCDGMGVSTGLLHVVRSLLWAYGVI